MNVLLMTNLHCAAIVISDVEKYSLIAKGAWYTSEAIYSGDFNEDGYLTGLGTMMFYDGTISVGYFSNNKLYGQGEKELTI
ncbi:MAG: hypothetical protein ACI4DP_00165 [Candidatus Ornithomonoglobus sp.]